MYMTRKTMLAQRVTSTLWGGQTVGKTKQRRTAFLNKIISVLLLMLNLWPPSSRNTPKSCLSNCQPDLGAVFVCSCTPSLPDWLLLKAGQYKYSQVTLFVPFLEARRLSVSSLLRWCVAKTLRRLSEAEMRNAHTGCFSLDEPTQPLYVNQLLRAALNVLIQSSVVVCVSKNEKHVQMYTCSKLLFKFRECYQTVSVKQMIKCLVLLWARVHRCESSETIVICIWAYLSSLLAHYLASRALFIVL